MAEFQVEGTVTVEQQGHVLMIGLDNPAKLNAFDTKMFRDLAAAYGELEADPELRCGVLFGQGDHFTSGLDMPKWEISFQKGELGQIPEGGIDPLGLREPHLTKPVVIAVQGWCLTIGIELLLACDVRVAASDARFGQIEVKRGIYPVGGATARLPREIGWGNAMRYMLTGDTFSADEAYRMGLIQEVTEPGKQVDRALEIAQQISHQAPLGVYTALKSARQAVKQGEEAACAQLLANLQPLLDSQDYQEGLNSFLEKRDGVFNGK